jgi:serine protease inhibitor
MQLQRTSFLRLTAVASIVCAACTSSTEPGAPPTAISALPRSLTDAELRTIESANAFTFALFRKVSDANPDSNVFISPLSASLALGMTLNGARGSTFDGMRTALQLGTATQGDINTSYQSLMSLLRSIDPTVELDIANSIWYRNTVPLLPAFTDAAKTYFDANAAGLDFTNVPASKAIVNGWVSDKTRGKIPSIIDDITQDDIAFLINAIYFKGKWRAQFDPAKTTVSNFTPASGTVQHVPLMAQSEELRYGGSGGVQIIDLPYGNSAFTMTVVLPPVGVSVEQYASGLTPAVWASMTSTLSTVLVNLTMPRLRLEYARTMNDDLSALGMGVAFIKAADFSDMSPMPGLFIKYVKQKAYVDINEEGTEAAAVTVVGIVATSAQVSVTMRVDRPYLFVIRERLSGTIVFIGKVNIIPS